jgi:predicted lipid-binding transport protein (Tim44 family)
MKRPEPQENHRIEICGVQCQMRVMGFFSDPLNLVLMLIAAVAGFKLWQVLGLRIGAPPIAPAAPFQTQPLATDLESKAITRAKPVWEGVAQEGSPLAQSLQAIADKAPEFNGAEFLKAGTSAHERIMEAFASGNATALKLLLNEPTFKIFEAEIRRRTEAGEQAIFKFVGPEAGTVLNARVNGNLASIEVGFTSQVVSAIKAKSGALLSGDEKRIVTLREVWTFERIMNPADPNWRLADTREDA